MASDGEHRSAEASPAPPASRGFLDHVQEIRKILKPCRFSIGVVLACVIAFLGVDQGQDLLRRLWEWNPRHHNGVVRRLLFFYAALFGLSLSSWYFSRVMLYLRFPDTPADSARVRRLRKWIPRVLGQTVLLGMAAAFVRAALSYEEAAHKAPRFWLFVGAGLCLVLSAAFAGLVVGRRKVLKNRGGRAATDTMGARTLTDLPTGTKRAILACVGVALFLFVLFSAFPVGVAPLVGSVAIVLSAAAAWIPLGTGLAYLGGRYRIPLITLLFLGAIVFSFWNDNHAVRRSEGASTGPPVLAPSLHDHLDTWVADLKRQRPGLASYPVFLVASEGGGIRAAYWTASVLGEIQGQAPAFPRHLYAISGVSGGSVGGGVYAALVAEAAEDGTVACDAGDGQLTRHSLANCARAILDDDFLSPTLAAMLYPDLVQRFLPFPVPPFDRARSLEEGWEKGWETAIRNDRLARPFSELWQDPSKPVPNLVLNGTWVESGKRILTTNLRFGDYPFNDSLDFFRVMRRDIPLSTAMHNSARFTYVSPAGRMVDADGANRAHIVDGGYFENSGVNSATELLSGLITLSERTNGLIKPVVIVITNTPLGSSAVAPTDGLLETRAPFTTLFATRGARGSYAVAALDRLKRENGVEVLAFGTCERSLTGQKFTAPLGWELSGLSTSEMNAQLLYPCKGFDNPGTIRKIRQMLQGGEGSQAPAPTVNLAAGQTTEDPRPEPIS